MSQIYITPKEAMNRYLRNDDGTFLISRASLMKMCSNGTIPNCTSLGMTRKIFIPVEVCEKLWGKKSLKDSNLEVKRNG